MFEMKKSLVEIQKPQSPLILPVLQKGTPGSKNVEQRSIKFNSVRTCKNA